MHMPDGYASEWERAEQELASKLDLTKTDILRRIHALGLPPAYFSGRDILDIGAGNGDVLVDGSEEVFQPWFCRVMQSLGSNACAMDKGPNRGESFENHQIDILRIAHRKRLIERMLRFRKFDVIHTHRFLACPPQNDDPWRPPHRNESPAMLRAMRERPQEVQATRRVIPQLAKSLLKNGGYLFWEHSVWRKKQGKLRLERNDGRVL
jgi:hypothetical protein